MEWVVEFVDEFEKWWDTLSESEQEKVAARVQLLMERGPNLGFPYSSNVLTSKFPEMRELRAQAGGGPVADALRLRRKASSDFAARRRQDGK